jgi:hypothetical protein
MGGVKDMIDDTNKKGVFHGIDQRTKQSEMVIINDREKEARHK